MPNNLDAALNPKSIAATGKPLVLSVPQTEIAVPFVKLGVPVFASDRQALQALHQISAHAALMQRKPGASGPSGGNP